MKRDKTSEPHLNHHHPHRLRRIVSFEQSTPSTTCSPSPLAEGPSWWVQTTGRQTESSSSPWAPLRPGLAQEHPCLWIRRSLTPSGKDGSLAKIAQTSLCRVVSLLNPSPLSICLALTLVVKKLRILLLFPLPAVENSQHAPLFSLFLPSLTTRAAGVNEASLWVSAGEREGKGWAQCGGVAWLERRRGRGERGSGPSLQRRRGLGGIFPDYLRADVDSVIRKK